MALRALVVRLDRVHLDPAAAGGADRALRIGIDGAGGRRRLGLVRVKLIGAIGLPHRASIPEPNWLGFGTFFWGLAVDSAVAASSSHQEAIR